jgi:hypothetical protein
MFYTKENFGYDTNCVFTNPPQTGQLLKYSHEITLQNLAAPNNPNFLWSCGATPSPLCGRSVATFTKRLGDYLYANDEGKWRILDSQGNTSTAQLNYGDTIMLQNTIDNFILETCGLSDCNNGNQLYNVSTYNGLRSPMHDVQRWKIVSSTGATGAVRTGDDIKLLNLAGYTSYLNTCGVKTGGCGTGQLYGVNTCKLGSHDASHITSNWRISTSIPINPRSFKCNDKKLTGFDYITLTDKTLDQCKSACGGYDHGYRCKSFDYDRVNKVCNISYDTAGKHGAPELSSGVGWDYYERDSSSYYELVPGRSNVGIEWRGTVDKPYGSRKPGFFCDRTLNGADCYGTAICDPMDEVDALTDWATAFATFGISEIPGVNLSEALNPFYGKLGTCEIEWDERNPSNFAHDRAGPDKDGCTIQPFGACNHSSSLRNGDDGCCKDYTAEGGENHFCRDSGLLFSTDYRCRPREE